jgi:hypothetical protein
VRWLFLLTAGAQASRGTDHGVLAPWSTAE